MSGSKKGTLLVLVLVVSTFIVGYLYGDSAARSQTVDDNTVKYRDLQTKHIDLMLKHRDLQDKYIELLKEYSALQDTYLELPLEEDRKPA